MKQPWRQNDICPPICTLAGIFGNAFILSYSRLIGGRGGHKGRNPRKKTFSLGIAQRKRGELQKLILEIIKSKKKLPILVCRGDSVAQINFDTFYDRPVI